MQLSASVFYRAYRPSECDLRLYLYQRGVEAAEAGPYEKVIRRLGKRHENAHLVTFQNVVDVGAGTYPERRVSTLEAITAARAVIYQPLFMDTVELRGRATEIVGIPDFLIRESDGYVIRDVKMSRRVNEEHHREILLQIRLYGWLFRRATGLAPLRLEVLNGKSEVVVIEPADITEELERVATIIHGAEAPFEPVGWSRCGSCGYNGQCWGEAEARRDVALVPKVDKSLARALRTVGVVSYDDLLAQYDEEKLSTFQRPHGRTVRKVGKAAPEILLSARALQSNKPIPLAPPTIPNVSNFAMFDLEGLPPQLDDLEKIYLWGLQVFGEKPSGFCPATAGFGDGGDADGWNHFLKNAEMILAEYGDIPFVHWSHYERTKLRLYVDRHGDPAGIAAAVERNLFDLLPVVQATVVLPLASYSLKVVEDYIGFERTQTEYGGTWAMAHYIEATETEDETTRNELVADILKYNEEDLAATWAVLCWLTEFGRSMTATC